MATYQKFNCLVADMANKVHNFGSDTLKVALTNTAPTAADEDLTDIVSAVDTSNLDSISLVVSSSAQSSGTYKLIVADKVMTASGAVATFRYIVIYNDTSTADSLVCFFDYGESRTMSNGETLTLDFDGSNGLFSIAPAA